MPSARRKKNIVPDTIREKIVDFVVHCGKTKAQVRDQFVYPYTNTNSIIQKYKDTGKTASRRKKGGAFRGLKVGEDDLNAMLEFVGQHPCATIEEICQHLWEERSLEVSEKTVCHALRNRLHITLKRVNVEHNQHNSPAAIKAWQAWVRSCCASGRSLNKAVFLDKAGFHLQQTRNFGRAPQGERMTQREAGIFGAARRPCGPDEPSLAGSEQRMAVAHAGVSLLGFGIDFAILHGAMQLELEPAWARVISLACAMQVTFALNGALVFRCLNFRAHLLRQWAAYMATNAFGNLCNYWLFVTLVSLHGPMLSRPAVAIAIRLMPSSFAIETAIARPRALKEPVGSRPSSLIRISPPPIRRSIRGVRSSGVTVSPRLTTFSRRRTGRNSR